MTRKLLKEFKKGLGIIQKVTEGLAQTIEEVAINDESTSVHDYNCRYEGCDKSYRHESSRAAHERDVHGETWSQRRRKDD